MHMIGTPLEVPVFKRRDNASVIFAFLVSENGFLLGKEIPFNARLLPFAWSRTSILDNVCRVGAAPGDELAGLLPLYFANVLVYKFTTPKIQTCWPNFERK
jgi:hypothetical protein